MISGRVGAADISAAAGSGVSGSWSRCRIESGRNGAAAPARARLCSSRAQQGSRHRRYQTIAVDHSARHCRMHPAGDQLVDLLVNFWYIFLLFKGRKCVNIFIFGSQVTNVQFLGRKMSKFWSLGSRFVKIWFF